jgi:hypothetical protein
MRPVPVWSVVLVASAASLLVWVLAVPLAGVDLVVPGSSGSTELTVGPALIVLTSALVTLGAWPVRAALRRRTLRHTPARTAAERRPGPAPQPVGWWVTCGLVLLASLAGPAGAGSAAAVAVLVVLHVLVGAVVVVGLDPRRARARTARTDAAHEGRGREGVGERVSQPGT